MTRRGLQLLVGQTATVDFRWTPSTLRRRHGHRRDAVAQRCHVEYGWQHPNSRCRSYRCRDATGWRWRCWRRKPADLGHQHTPLPDRNTGEQREFQFSIDGQQVASELVRRAAAYSKESIADSNSCRPVRRDTGSIVGGEVRANHAIGREYASGLGPGQLRDSRFNAENPA